MTTLIPAACVLALLGTGAVAAQSNNHANPATPGQDRTCLVTSGTPGSFNDSDVVDAKWLPRRAAEAQAAQNPTTRRVFDFDDDPLVTGGTYTSAEDLCNTHFTSSREEEGAADDANAGGANAAAGSGPSDSAGGADNNARDFAPGRQDGPARDSAPGQQDGPAKDSAPGQVKKGD